MGSSKCVSMPSCVTSTSGANASTICGTTASNTQWNVSSPVYGASGTFTEKPRPSPEPSSPTSPVPGKR